MSLEVANFSAKRIKEPSLQNTHIHYQLTPEELTVQTIQRNEGVLNDTGALCINTGEFTGRCPHDKFIVIDAETEDKIDWNNFNQPIEEKYFIQLRKKMVAYLNNKKDVWIR